MKIDIVVVNYKTPEDLNRFLRSLEAFEPILPCSLTVVNVEMGAAAGETYAIGFDWGEYMNNAGREIFTVDNCGYARACNLGADGGDGDIIAFFNADVTLTQNSLDLCARALYEHESWGILGPKQVDSKGLITSAGHTGTFTHLKPRAFHDADRGQYEQVEEVISVAGSAYFIKRHVWDELTECSLYQDVAPAAVGAFLPTQHYYEETWCSYHAHAHGWKVAYYGLVKMIHEWHQASPLGGAAEKAMPESRKYFRAACDHHGIEHD